MVVKDGRKYEEEGVSKFGTLSFLPASPGLVVEAKTIRTRQLLIPSTSCAA